MLLAPNFRAIVEVSITDCRAAGLDAMVWEAYRSNELQMLYYLRGRPPSREYPAPVTNAKSNLYSWHGYGLAVDVISQKYKWFGLDPKIRRTVSPDVAKTMQIQLDREGQAWFRAVADIFKKNGCDWGGDWTKPDLPHQQFGRLRPSPSDMARQLLRDRGLNYLWRYVGAA